MRGTDTRGELLAAARRVIRRDGFAGVTVGEITREAGASAGLLNYHFGSKDEVLAEAFDEIARGELADLEAIARRPDPPPDRLAAYLDSSDWGDREGWMLWLDAWADAARVEELRATLARYARGWRAALADVLADGARHGSWDCPDPAEAASRIVAVIDGIGLQAMLHPGEVTAERAAGWARRIVELELGIALPEPVPAPPADPPTSHSVRIGVRGRDLDADGSVHPAAMLGVPRGGARRLAGGAARPGRRAHAAGARGGRLPRAAARAGQRGRGALRAAPPGALERGHRRDDRDRRRRGRRARRHDARGRRRRHAPPARRSPRRSARRWRDEPAQAGQAGSTPSSAASTAQISARARSRGIAGSPQSTRMP